MDLELHHKQGEALLTKATEILYGGAAGGGKSHLLRVAAIFFCIAIPGLQVYLFRRTHPDLLKNHMEGPTSFPVLLADWVQSKLVKINYSDLTVEFWNGSKIFLCHCQYEKDRFKYQGAEIHLLLIDELTHFTEVIYRFLRGRCRLGALKVPEQYKGMFPRIINGSNPGNLGHNWVKFTFIDGASPMEIRHMDKKEGGMRRQFIPALLEDNPTLTENDPEYEDRLEGLGNPELVKAMRHGDWNIVAGGMFDDLWKLNKHVIKPFNLPESFYIDRSFDWGSSAPFAVLWWAESDGSEVTLADGSKRTFPRGTIFLFMEWYGWNGHPNEGLKMLAVDIARGIYERESKLPFKVNPGPADTQIFDAENGVCLADDMKNAEIVLENGERKKVAIKWLRADKSPGSRKTGWERIRKMLKAALQFPMEEPGLFIFENCHQWIRTVPSLPRSESDPDDVNDKAEDHCADPTRYRVMNPPKKVWSIA